MRYDTPPSMMSGEVGEMEMEDLNKQEDSNKQNTAPKAAPSPRPGRFQVNIVSENPEAAPKENKDKTSPIHSEPSSGGQSTPMGNEDFDQSMAMQTFGQNTIEVMPSLDYYRNLFSTSATAKQRPTLHDLHEPIKVSLLLRCDLFFFSSLMQSRASNLETNYVVIASSKLFGINSYM